MTGLSIFLSCLLSAPQRRDKRCACDAARSGVNTDDLWNTGAAFFYDIQTATSSDPCEGQGIVKLGGHLSRMGNLKKKSEERNAAWNNRSKLKVIYIPPLPLSFRRPFNLYFPPRFEAERSFRPQAHVQLPQSTARALRGAGGE